ncbi:MAG: 50S ribosomal protein L11 methyltransferase [Clostridia bacterium]|nr:50S ribosomal protein L11 methyltransferase [Clostridia bacterium]MBQ6614157.1 50S ribosomal protein L11 methyltransferase [Clostridia bacterium]
MQWIQIKVSCNTNDLDTIAAVMSMVDNSLQIEDFSDVTTDGMYGALLDESLLNADKTKAAVSVYIPETRSVSESVSFIESQLSATGVEYSIETIGCREEDWAESWKKYYHPIKVGKIVVVPAWEEYTAKDDEIIVTMDPGMAFGTGTHETTRLVISMLEKYVKTGDRMLDVGCGSGILAICARKLGADNCAAYDIDPTAVKVARENIEQSGVTNVTCDVSDLLRGVDLSGGKYNIVAANIVADIIIRMMPDIAKYMAEGATLIASGIICPRREEVEACMREHGFEVFDELVENDWCALVVRKK